MEFSELFSFVIILKESFLLLPKIWKFTLPTAAISLLLPSLFFLLFSHLYQIVTAMSTTRPEFALKYLLIPFFISEIVLGLVFVVSVQVAWVSTTIVSAVAYTGQSISPSDLLSRVRRSWRKPMKLSCSMSVQSTIGAVLVGGLTGAVIAIPLINPITICLLVVLWIGFIILNLKSSTGRLLARVVSVLEEAGDGSKAVERSEELVQGQRLKGFMFSLFINILLCACLLVFWMIVGDQGSMNFTIYGLFLVATMPIFSIFVSVMLTVFYFQCKKYQGEETDVVDLVQYTKLPATA